MEINAFYQNRQGGWSFAGALEVETGLSYADGNLKLEVSCRAIAAGVTDFELEFSSVYPTRIRLEGRLAGGGRHLIPCCIHGDNNLRHARPGQYPNLTTEYPGEKYSSPYWEFRADRASHPVSLLCGPEGVGAVSIDPYCRAEADNELIRNGVFAELPDRFGVTVGYANLPFTFMNKFCDHDDGTRPSTTQPFCGGKTRGRIFFFPGEGPRAVRQVIESLYFRYRERPVYTRSFRTAACAVVTAFVERNYSGEFDHYTNREAHPPKQTELKPWRALLEIGWTGGSILAYPFITAETVLGLPEDFFRKAKSGYRLFDEIIDCYNPASGMFYDLVRELSGSRVNGWWDFLRTTHDCHSAYTNGHAVYYLFKTMKFLRDRNLPVPERWEKTAVAVADTFASLQRADGCCGYAFATDRRAVADFDGFAGCWVGAALAAAHLYTGGAHYLAGARKAAEFYHTAVEELNCCGTPMDTWKAPDQEGNLAFMKLVRMLHEATGGEEFLAMLEDGAHYEYLWRYGFRAVPELLPLKGSGWNSCGGSVTSVSNPHIHPMGVLVTPELCYLAEKGRGPYHRDRALDGMAWAMNCLELYPEVTGIGCYGVTTERFCPSDGLTDCRYSDGRNSSIWFSYNGWAAANMLEALLWSAEHLEG